MIQHTVFHKSVDQAIYLKLLKKTDAEALFTVIEANRQYLRMWLPWIEYTTTTLDAEAYIVDNLDKYTRGENLITGIWQYSDLIGCIGFNQIDYFQQKAAIGYWLSAEHQGKGIVTRACLLLIAYAFNELHLEKLEILCAVKNNSSRAVAKRLHFKQEAIITKYIPQYNQPVDMILYSISRQGWKDVYQHIS